MGYQFTTQNFEAEVMQSTLPVLIDFYADWCGPCKMMAPVVERMATEYDGRLKVGKINVDNDPELAQKYKVVSIPTFVVVKNGEVQETFVGAMSAAQLAEKVEKYL